MTGHVIVGRLTPGIGPNKRRPVEEMTDSEIKHKLCKDVRGGCEKCEVAKQCRYGQEAKRRGLI